MLCLPPTLVCGNVDGEGGGGNVSPCSCFMEMLPRQRARDPSFLLPQEQPFTAHFIKNHISGGVQMGRWRARRIWLHEQQVAAYMCVCKREDEGGGVRRMGESCVWHLVKKAGHHRHDILQLHPIYCSEEMERDGGQLALWPRSSLRQRETQLTEAERRRVKLDRPG